MKKRISNSKLNLSIDLIMFVVLMAISGIGFMIKYVLIPGFKRNEIYGKDVELYYWGLDRHQWGNIHFIVSLVLLILLLLHIVFHWKQIVGIFKRMVVSKTWRLVFVLAFVFISIALGIMPFFVKPQIDYSHKAHHEQLNTQKSEKHEQDSTQMLINSEPVTKPSPINSQVHTNIDPKNEKVEHYKNNGTDEIEVYGYMTINDLAEKYNVSAWELDSCINLPKSNNDEKLGRLRRKYAFQLNDIRNYIAKQTMNDKN